MKMNPYILGNIIYGGGIAHPRLLPPPPVKTKLKVFLSLETNIFNNFADLYGIMLIVCLGGCLFVLASLFIIYNQF